MKNQLKILHFHPDGRMAEKFVQPLIDKERGCGFTSKLIVSRGSTDSLSPIKFDINLALLIFAPISLYKLYKIISSCKPKVVIAHNSRSALLPLFLAWILRVKHRIYFNHGVPYCAYGGVLCFILKNLERANIALSTEVITVSKDMTSLLCNVSPKVNPKLLGNGSACGIDLEKFKISSIEKKIERTWVFIGRPEVRKGFRLVLELWFKYFKDSSYTLTLCGPTKSDVLLFLPYIPSNILCLGFVDNVDTILARSTGLILPSYHEGFSYAILESMAAGTIVLANNIPGITSIIENGVNGFLIDGNKLDDYADLIHEIDLDPSLRNRIIEQAIHSSSKYDRSSIIGSYISYLLNLT